MRAILVKNSLCDPNSPTAHKASNLGNNSDRPFVYNQASCAARRANYKAISNTSAMFLNRIL